MLFGADFSPSAKAAPGRAALDVLGLRAQSVAFRQGDAPGSFPSLPHRVRAVGPWGRGPMGSRRGKRERPRSRVDRARVTWMKNARRFLVRPTVRTRCHSARGRLHTQVRSTPANRHWLPGQLPTAETLAENDCK